MYSFPNTCCDGIIIIPTCTIYVWLMSHCLLPGAEWVWDLWGGCGSQWPCLWTCNCHFILAPPTPPFNVFTNQQWVCFCLSWKVFKTYVHVCIFCVLLTFGTIVWHLCAFYFLFYKSIWYRIPTQYCDNVSILHLY